MFYQWFIVWRRIGNCKTNIYLTEQSIIKITTGQNSKFKNIYRMHGKTLVFLSLDHMGTFVKGWEKSVIHYSKLAG